MANSIITVGSKLIPIVRPRSDVTKDTRAVNGIHSLNRKFPRIIGTVSGDVKIVQLANGSTTNVLSSNVDGGGWMLAVHWVGREVDRKMKDVAVKGRTLLPYTSSPATKPALPNGLTNNFTELLFIEENPTWQSLFGDWQIFKMLEQNFSMTAATPWVARNNLGQNKNFWLGSTAWGVAGTEDYPFTLWNVPNNSSYCGGANQAGGTKICPAIVSGTGYNPHCEFSSNKYLFVR